MTLFWMCARCVVLLTELEMKTLIVNFSFTGNNLMLAQEMKKRLNCAILQVKERGKRTSFKIFTDNLFQRSPGIFYDQVNLNSFEHIVFIAPVWLGKIASPLKSFIRKEKGNISQYSFLSVCGGEQGQHLKLEQQLTSIAGKNPTRVSELQIRDLLSHDQKSKAAAVASYRLHSKDLEFFANKIDEHVLSLKIPKVVG